MGRENEVETLSKRFSFSKEQVQNALNYYLTRELTDIPEDILESAPTFVSNWGNKGQWNGDYQGIELKIIFTQEGSKQFWLGVTHVGNSPFSLREHHLGYIEINL